MSIARRPRRMLAALLALFLIGGLLISAASADVAEPKGTTGSAPSPWWVDWLEAIDKNGNRIDDQADAIASRRIEAGRPQALVPVLVSFRSFPRDMGTWLGRVGAASDAYVFKTQPVVDLNIPARNLPNLSTAPGVVAVEYDRPLYQVLNVSAPAIQANNGSGSNTFYNGRTAEDLGYTGQGMVVAVLDTGVQDQHSAFAGKWIAGTDVSPQIPVGTCFNPPDDSGHGTHVASTALGQIPGNALFGTAKAAKLVEVKIAVGGATATVGPASIGSTNRGFEFVKLYNDRLAAGNPLCGPNDDHIDVATLSFGSLGRGGPNAGSTETFIDALVDSGVAVTIAVGNCGPQASGSCLFSDNDNGISSPGNAAGAIGVASFNDLNTVDRANDAISGFSSRGPNNQSGDTAAGGATSAADLKDRYRKPDVAAPGESIQAAGPVPFTLTTFSGTSMATPHVAGVAALLLQAGEQVKDQTGGVNLMASAGNGFSSGNDYSFGDYPVRDALVHATDYKEAGAKALWTGPNSRGVSWNNAWGYGQVNAFDALCWAWGNVLSPGGATPPGEVEGLCDLSPSPTPTPTPSDTPSPSPTECPGSPSSAASTRYYFHSASGIGNIDWLDDSTTFDKESPTFDAPAEFFDVSPLANGAPNQPWDPSWIGNVSERIDELEVEFWARVPVGRAFGQLDYDVSVWVGNTRHALPTITEKVPAALSNGYLRVVHRFDEQNAGDVLPIEPTGERVTIVIGHHFSDFGAGSSIRYDSKTMPSGFTVTTLSCPVVSTQLEFSSDAYAGTYSHETTIEATLTDEDGNPLSDQDVTFEFTSGNGSSDSLVVATDGDGVASADLPADLVPGTYQLFARFAGEDGAFETSSDSAILEVAKEDTSITTGASGKGPRRQLEATLVDHDGAPAIEGRTIAFYGVEGELLGTDETDENGFASIPAGPGYRGKDAIWEARFDGSEDELYASSSTRHPS